VIQAAGAQEENSISSSTGLSIGVRVRMPVLIGETDIAMMAEHNQICERTSSRVSDQCRDFQRSRRRVKFLIFS